MTGHQPAPFHPGVWIKNFATAALARRLDGVGVNLVVDGDLRASSTVRVPVGGSESPWVETVPFDGEQPATPWEESVVVDPETWRTLSDRLRGALAEWGLQPSVARDWPEARAGDGLAELLTRVRVRTERRWGCENLEVRQSRLCETSSFARFLLHLARDAERFRELHNEVLGEYRRANGIRGATHPVPALDGGDDWTELPFWTWNAGGELRRPVVVRRRADRLVLGDRDGDLVELPTDAEAAVAAIGTLKDRGVRLRTRALTTTLYARLFLSDLFVHGVGGAKYDEMTDRLIERFFGLPVPRFLLLSATRHLPFSQNGVAAGGLAEARARLHRRERSLRYNPERHVDGAASPVARELVARKAELVEQQHSAEAAREPRRSRSERHRDSVRNRRRFDELQEVNKQLAELLSQQWDEWRGEVERLEQRERAETVLANREWAWWLFPEESLRPFLTGLDVGG